MRSHPDARRPRPAQMGPDRLAVALEMAGDRGDRPAALEQCMSFHVFPMCEHAGRDSFGLAAWSPSASKENRFRGWMVQLTGAGWGISVIESGEVQKSRAADRMDRPDGRRPPRPVRDRPAAVRRLRADPRRRVLPSPPKAGTRRRRHERANTETSPTPLTFAPRAVIITSPTLTPGQVVPSHCRKGGPIKLAGDTGARRESAMTSERAGTSATMSSRPTNPFAPTTAIFTASPCTMTDHQGARASQSGRSGLRLCGDI